MHIGYDVDTYTHTVWTKVKWNAKQACFARIDGHFWRMANQRE